MKKLKWIMPTILIALMIIMGVYVLKGYDLVQARTDKSSETSLLQDNLVELSELATLKYEYSNVIISRTEKNLSLPGISDIKYAEAIKLITYSGYLKAGTDLAKVQTSDDKSSMKLTIKIPKSKILDNVAEIEKIEDVKGNLFSDYPSQLMVDEVNTQKKELQEEKISQGFLEEADQRVRQLLMTLYKTEGYADYDIVVEFF